MAKNPYASIKEYFTYVNEVSERSNKFLPGFFYAYEYRFPHDKPFKELKFYDKYPLIFLIGKGKGANTYIGLNFHQIPVRSRLIWLTRFNKIAGILNEDERAYMYYESIKSMYKKATHGVRVYRLDRVFTLRRIDSTKMYDISRFYAKTYYGVSIEAINIRYEQDNIRR